MDRYIPPYTISNEMVNLVSDISELISSIEGSLDFKHLPILRKQNRIRSVHSSCAIEANSLSIDQVEDIIDGKKVVGAYKDIKEVQNALKAYESIEKIDPFKETELLRLHKIMTEGTVAGAGTYRNGEEGVFDGNRCIFLAPPHQNVPSLISSLFQWMSDSRKEVHPLILSSIFHYEFVFIHPFSDGNGRMARLWQSALLGTYKKLFYNMPLENAIKDNQDSYYGAIDICNKAGNSDAFIVFMLKMIERTLKETYKEAEAQLASADPYVTNLLAKMSRGLFYTSKELLALLNLKSRDTLRVHYLNPAIKSGYLSLEFPKKPTSKRQRYKKTRA